MIRTERLSLDTSTFAAERREILNRSDNEIRQSVRTSLMRLGLPRWEDNAVYAALDVFDLTVREEVDEWSQVIDDLRADFERQLRETLAKTKTSNDLDRQTETVTRWLSTASVNAGTEAATTADPDEAVGLEWVTMGDGDVREVHKETNGQTVPSGMPFSVGGEELLYPGQPVGDPSVWINCRCVARPTMLEGFTAKGGTFAAEEKTIEEKKQTSTVIVALPEESNSISSISSEEDGAHCTLIYLGDSSEVDGEALKVVIQEFIDRGEVTSVTDSLNGTGVLGKDEAQVALLDAKNLIHLRAGLLEQDYIAEQYERVEQFPTWIPHVTLGYPDTPSNSGDLPETVTFDRLALWHGDEKTEFVLGGEPVSDAIVAAAEEETVGIPTDEEGTEEPPMIPDEEATEEVPWHGVLAPEGRPSGDGRQFGLGALTHRQLPLPLKYMPADAEGHDGSVVAGRIDRIFRDGDLIKAEGVFDNSEWGYEAIRQIASDMIRGVSVDVDMVEASLENSDDSVMEFSSSRIAAATLCAIPAFAEAFVALGPWEQGEVSEEEEVAENDAPAEGEEPVEKLAGGTGTFKGAPGLKKDGTPPKCDYCDVTATQYVLHSEGKAFVPACDEHIEQAKTDAAGSVPGGESDPSNVDRVADYSLGTYDIAPRKTKDGPGWITEPKPTQRITGYWVDGPGALKINWGAPGDFNRCRANLAKYVQNPDWLAGLCANLHYRALGAWPGQASGRTEEMEHNNAITASATLVDSRERLSADYFKHPGDVSTPVPLTVTEPDENGVRRVYGHLATWGVCHIGIGDACVEAPESSTDYAYFATGNVLTDAGPVRVGQITMGGGHADLRKGMRAAIAHYDSTSAAVADVAVHEDSVGVYVAGIMRPKVTEDQVYELRASGVISGDWREVIVGGKSAYELCAALAVNVPGFPIPRTAISASAGTGALVAASIVQGEKEVVKQEKPANIARNAAVRAARAKVRGFKLEQARSLMESEGR